jgi:hypothetical protein
LKTGHCLTGQYLQRIKNRPSAKCGWCPCKVQTREHLFRNCPRWKAQQKIVWAEVWKEAGRGKDRFKIRDLFANEQCTRSILDILHTTEVGGKTKPKEAREQAQSEDMVQEREEGVGQEDDEEESGDSEWEEGENQRTDTIFSFRLPLSFPMSINLG